MQQILNNYQIDNISQVISLFIKTKLLHQFQKDRQYGEYYAIHTDKLKHQQMQKENSTKDYDYKAKVIMIGDPSVGKTTLLLRYTSNHYISQYNSKSTLGVDFKIKSVEIEGVTIKMRIWDTADKEKFNIITQSYYKGAIGAVIVYSVTDRSSFIHCEKWIKQINQNQEQVCKIIVGNKIDCLPSSRQVSYHEGFDLADREGAEFIECSAKENINISDIFNKINKPIKDRLVAQSNLIDFQKKIKKSNFVWESKVCKS